VTREEGCTSERTGTGSLPPEAVSFLFSFLHLSFLGDIPPN